MPRANETTDIKGKLTKLSEFDPQAKTDVESVIEPPPDLPDIPGFEDFQNQPISKGIQIGRAVATFMAGLQDPAMAQFMVQQFQKQDYLAQQDVINRYNAAVAQTEAQIEEIKFEEGYKQNRFEQSLATAKLQLDAAIAVLRAKELEFAQKQSLGKANEMDALELSEAQKLVDRAKERQVGGLGKPVQIASFDEAVKLGYVSRLQALQLAADTPENLQTKEKLLEQARQQAASRAPIIPPIISQGDFYDLVGMAEGPQVAQLLRNSYLVAPDPRTLEWDDPRSFRTWAVTLKALARDASPELHDLVIDKYADVLVSQGWNRRMAEEWMADLEFNEVDPSQDIPTRELTPEGQEFLFPDVGPSKSNGQKMQDFKPPPQKRKNKRPNPARGFGGFKGQSMTEENN